MSAYIALTPFAARAKLGRACLPAERIFVKPNFAPDPGPTEPSGDYALFVGRLSPEKGIRTLIEADRHGLLIADLVIIGDGPLRGQVLEACARPGSRLRYKGYRSHAESIQQMREAKALLVPSLWYEGFPLVIAEAFSLGVPVIGADIGSVAGIVTPGRTGLLHAPGDFRALAECLSMLIDQPALAADMRRQARDTYLTNYTEELNHSQLVKIYEWAICNPVGSQKLVTPTPVCYR